MTASDLAKYFDMVGEGKRMEAELFREKDIPNTLIKHFWLKDEDEINAKESNEQRFQTLENNMLWFSAVSKFNDPYEFKGMIVNEKAFRDAGQAEEFIESFSEFLRMEEYGAVCLSAQDVDYLPMWAYYTNNYKGYCVEYEVVSKACIHQVMYETNRIPIASLFFQLKDELNKAIKCGQKRTPETDRIASIIRQNLYIKSKSWEHEREYRIAVPISNGKGENLRISDFGLRVKRIIIGEKCLPQNAERLNEISNKIGCGNAYRSCLSNEKYGMELIRL